MERAFGGPGALGRWWNNPRIVERLKLTDEQRKTFDGIFLAHREKLIDLRANLEKSELAMEPLMRDDSPNEVGILAQIDKIAQARAELEKANARFLLALRARLTPEQWKTVQAFRADRENQHRAMDERGPGGDGARGERPAGWKQNGPGGSHSQPPPSGPPQGDAPQAPEAAPAAPGSGDGQ
jgi:Spy/CpxP family protein refolding chaperone